MAHPRSLRAPLSRLTISSIVYSTSSLPRFSAISYQTIRSASEFTKKKKKKSNEYKQHDLRKADQFCLLDAMHYIRAFEVGQVHAGSKYEVHVRLATLRNAPAIRTRLRLPHRVKLDARFAVLAAPDSTAAAEARAEGITLVGEDEILDQVKEGKIEFDRLLCHIDSLPKLNKSGAARILGPKGLMPNTKTGTLVTRMGPTLRTMFGTSEYREKDAVVRLAVGQLEFSPEMLKTNIKVFIDSLKRDIANLKGKVSKDIYEVVLSSTHGPGFSLNGEFRGPESLPPSHLSGPL
ncbi:hypothetical protein IAQ61_011205 [Plenodomus lingam]|uniref:Similar to mitochondrial large ribosomal subunit protein L1 n=1 Tax=Leptosphaeria maculans (strain JN3 / isolate v23.1.3 / race Av1-4-5-6-7-8) TaxID=985895 RepID=E5A9D1_LEPMJ|nr:similar to mitochondrial large ribosomal subunit protein L1 [Plenodomus lingam JN3]KAH9859424.1 hypothetical protein IAQ61_011205 [Plenodomus lingam]CBY00272.1 similar to mitochondrial large ribosomal subunit protein L1 [Plenodomus lingam JN3]